jgi:hypothetical protein
MRSAVSLLAIGFLACGANGNESDVGGPSSAGALGDDIVEQTSPGEQSRSELRASDMSVQLGLDRWEFDEGGIYGLTRDGEVLAEFQIQPDNSAVESILPEQGIRKMDGSEDFPPAAGQFYDALTLDLQSLSNSADLAALPAEVEKIVVNCFLILDNCFAEAVQRQVLFGQSCSCSLNVAACSVFLPLALDCF